MGVDLCLRERLDDCVGIALSSFGVSSGSLGIPTFAWRVVSRSEALPTHSLPLPRDGLGTE